MNKIYKVIWSKVRNCYVAVSEIAKRNGKSCTSVNCGAKANRGHAGVALAIAVLCAVPVNAMAANSGGNADGPSGQEYIGFSPYEVTIDSGWGGDVYGRKESESDAKSAKVTISAGTVTYTVFGGRSASGHAGGANEGEGNSVTINGGTVNKSVYGGYTDGTGSAQNNTVTISGTSTIGTGDYALAGGKANGSGDATGNSVIVKGGTVNEKSIFGGNSYNGGNATNNKVIISGGTIKHNSSDVEIYGGGISSGTTTVTGNIVTLAGGEFSSDSSFDRSFFIVGGRGTPSSDSSTINNNTVNLYGNVEGLGPANLFGAFFGNTSIYLKTGEDNELHIGGVKDNAMLAADKSAAPWTGTEGNKVNMVRNFSSIVLHKVNWSPDTANTTGTPVLAAKSFSNIGILDISGMDIQGTKTFETMTLLQSDNAPFGNLKLTYIDTNNQKQSDKPIGDGLVLKPFSNFGTDTSKAGVTVAYDGAVKVTRPTDNKSIKYSISQEYTGATLGAMNWGEGYTFASGAVIKSGGLAVTIDGNFAVTGAVNQENNQSFNLLNLNNASDSISEVINTEKLTTLPDAVVKTGLTFAATRTDTIATDTNKKNLIYTTGATRKVTTATFNGAINWDTTTPYYDVSDTTVNNKGYTFDGDTGINATNLTFTGTTDTNPMGQSTVLLANATNISGDHITQPGTGIGTVTVADYADTKGILFDATATGSVVVEDSAVKYKVNTVKMSSVDLKNWDGTVASPTSAVPTGWTAQDGGVAVYTDNMTKLPTNLAPGGSVDILTGSAGFFVDDKIQGARKYQNGDAFTVKPNGDTGMVIAGNKVGGVKAENIGENVGAKLTYYAEKKSVSTITLGTETFTNGGTVYGGAESEFTNMYDATGATINTDALAFSNSSIMEAGDSMTVLDASKAIKDGSGHALPAFTTQKTSFVVGFTDEVTDKGLTFKGTHTDTLSNDQTKMVYTVGNKVVSGDDAAALTGSITWNDSTPHYTNTKYTFDSTSKTNLSGLTFGTVTTDPYGKSMTLISGNMAGTVSNEPASFGVSLAKTNTTLEATAAGSAAIDSGDLKYTVSGGVTIDKINVKQVTDTAEVLPTGWVLKKSGSTIATTVETGTGTTAMTTPSGLNPGDTRVIFTAGESLEGITINGDFKWKEDNSDLPGTAENGVVITGKQTKGGVRVNTANTNQLIYEESKKNVTGISFSETTFVNGSTARSLDNNYDATGAAIDPDGLTFTEASRAIMETGNTMTMVDATAAIQNASNETLVMFGGKTYNPIAFTDTVTAKNLTFVGTHTDTLSQEDDAATSTKKSKLIYTVGDKKVRTATLTGAIAWSDGDIHYTNGSDANQNGTKATYTFDSDSDVDISGVTFSATSDPLAGSTKSMTLLKGVTGVVATKVSGTPSFTVTLDQTNTKLDANATGSAAVSGSDVTYTVSGVTINKVNIKSVGSTADTVPANWTLASGATVETDNMTAPSGLTPGETKAIITASGTDYFNGVKVNGSHAWTAGGALTSDLEADGVTIAGTQTKGGVKVNEANKNQLIYEETKKKLTSITLGEVTFAKDGTARAFDKTYDATSATINANNLKFAEASRAKMETGNTMTMVDATAALKNANDETLAQFNGGADKTYSIAFNDTVTGKNLTLAGTHTDTLSQADDTATSTKKSKLVYTVGDKLVSSATLTGDIAWNDGGTHYTNGSDANQNGTKATYKFDGNSAVDISGVAFSATADPLAGTTKSMTLLKGVTGVVATKVSGTPSFAVTLDQTNTKQDASASGSAGVSGSDVTYTVSGVAINKVNIKSVGSTADTVPDNWTLANGATVETDDLVVASPSGLEPGVTKVIIEAATGSKGFFKDVAVNGSHAWKVDDSTITSDLDIGGVAITGTQTKGGVKVNEANTNQIIYEESKKKINTLTLGSVTFANDDGTAATVARAFDKTYDVSTATINADDLAFSNSDIMETGNSMRIVDASAAIPNAISNKKLPAFTEQTKKVAFTDTITGKNLTLKGAHTDTLSQDAAQTTLTYTVGDKKVSTATLTGDIAWNDGSTHYTNGSDANQNGTKATYTFDSDSDVDISGVTFSATSDPLAGSTKSMTLLKGVNGVAVNKVSGVPAFAVTIDQINTKLDAKATGASGVSGNDVTFTVSGVTLDKITVKSANGTADKVPASWTMAAGATIETDSMTVPELAAGTHVDILQSDTDGFFAKVAINGANAYGNTQDAFTESDAAKSVTIAGTQDKGVTLNTEKKHLIYKAGTLDVASVTLGPAEWEKGATVFDRSGAGYNYAGVAALGTDGFAVSYASPETVATGDSMTLLQANKTLSDMAEQVKKTSYSYTPVTGVTIDANITGKLATSGGAVTYTAATNQAGKLTFTNVDWKDSGALMTRPKNITFSGADVDTAKINFTNITLLDANKQMTLVSDFGDKVGTITGTKYMVGTTSEGEGVASLSGSDLIFTTKTGAGGAAEQTHRTVMATEAGIAALAAGQEYVDSAVEGLGMLTNLSPDGTSTFAAMGGGASRYKTGSHVDTRTWNAVVAVGSKREHKKGTFEWGVFAEYGKGNYTLHSDDGGRGDGDTHYAGGGLLAKWTNKHKVYTEASVRMGRISDSASNMLRDGAGNQYGYNVHANYYGGHIGIGKLFEVKKNRELDVYGKFFYTRRNGVSFNAAGRYDLDAVNSSLLRVGARYGSTDKKWNWYGGLAYEYQFDGESGGMLNGNTPIRAASIKGGSVRGEIGLRMDATETNPWKVDFSIYGYGGKHRGIGGSVNVAYMF